MFNKYFKLIKEQEKKHDKLVIAIAKTIALQKKKEHEHAHAISAISEIIEKIGFTIDSNDYFIYKGLTDPRYGKITDIRHGYINRMTGKIIKYDRDIGCIYLTIDDSTLMNANEYNTNLKSILCEKYSFTVPSEYTVYLYMKIFQDIVLYGQRFTLKDGDKIMLYNNGKVYLGILKGYICDCGKLNEHYEWKLDISERYNKKEIILSDNFYSNILAIYDDNGDKIYENL